MVTIKIESESPLSLGLMVERELPAGATNADVAYSKIRTAILKTQLKPDQAIDQEVINSIVGGIGKTPTRDALQRLAGEGLVVIEPRRGTRVSPLSIRDLQEVFEARMSLEVAISFYAMKNKTANHILEFRQLLKENVSGKDKPSEVESDGRMHQILLGMMNNRFLASTYRSVMDFSLRLMYLTDCSMDARDDHIENLKNIIQSLEQDNLADLENILTNHVREFRSRVTDSLGMGADAGPHH